MTASETITCPSFHDIFFLGKIFSIYTKQKKNLMLFFDVAIEKPQWKTIFFIRQNIVGYPCESGMCPSNYEEIITIPFTVAIVFLNKDIILFYLSF